MLTARILELSQKMNKELPFPRIAPFTGRVRADPDVAAVHTYPPPLYPLFRSLAFVLFYNSIMTLLPQNENWSITEKWES